MRGSLKVAFILGSLFTAGSALAQSPGNVQIGIPSYSGTGCPIGSVAATVSPDGLSLSLLFSSLQVNVGGSRVAYERKSCSISLPVTVPQGYQVMISRVDYRGYALTPQGSNGSFDIRYAFTGMAGLGFQQGFRTVQNGNFTLNNIPVDDRSAWTSCGSPTTVLSTTANLALQSNLTNQQATLIIDSADSASGLTYQLKFARCANIPAPTTTTTSNCQVMNGANAAGVRLYRVIDRMGRILLSTTDNQQAIRTAQTDQRCFQ